MRIVVWLVTVALMLLVVGSPAWARAVRMETTVALGTVPSRRSSTPYARHSRSPFAAPSRWASNICGWTERACFPTP